MEDERNGRESEGQERAEESSVGGGWGRRETDLESRGCRVQGTGAEMGIRRHREAWGKRLRGRSNHICISERREGEDMRAIEYFVM